MVLETISQSVAFTASTIRQLACRNTGIGFDQCLIVEASTKPQIDFNYRIFNANGQEVGQCGNGARCLARFIEFMGLSNKRIIKVATATTQLELTLHQDKTVSVNMGCPRFEPKDIPLNVENRATSYPIPLSEQGIMTVHALSIGNPHAVLVVPDIANVAVQSLGRAICEHALFPEQVNVGFMQIINPGLIALRVYERGCGETLACGSGAAAAVAVGRLYYGLEASVSVTLRGGPLSINWPSEDAALMLRGPAEFIYCGKTLT